MASSVVEVTRPDTRAIVVAYGWIGTVMQWAGAVKWLGTGSNA